MKTVGTYVTREEAEAVRTEMMKRPATPYQDSVSLLHIKNHAGTRKSRLPFQVNGLTFGGAFSTAGEPEGFIPDTAADSMNRAGYGGSLRFWQGR